MARTRAGGLIGQEPGSFKKKFLIRLYPVCFKDERSGTVTKMQIMKIEKQKCKNAEVGNFKFLTILSVTDPRLPNGLRRLFPIFYCKTAYRHVKEKKSWLFLDIIFV